MAKIEEYKKPELIILDDPAFNETGQGSSGGLNKPPCPTLGGNLVCTGGTICNNGTCLNGVNCNGVR